MPKLTKQPSQDSIRSRIDNGHQVASTWTEFHAKLEKMRDTAWIFRGVSSPFHYPLPSIGRESVFGHYKLAQEKRLFQEFKNRAVALVSDPRFNDWHWLAFAQHIGVPTRLLDWTSSPLVAAFFALESESPEDRVIYAVKYSQYIHEVDHQKKGPFENSQEGRFSAPLAFDRIRAQRGLFTIHPDPTKIFYQEKMRTVLIPANKVRDFRRRLYKYGVDHWHVYPDMHGLGQQLSWQFQNKVGLGKIFTSQSRHA
jgi:hypothetical protein